MSTCNPPHTTGHWFMLLSAQMAFLWGERGRGDRRNSTVSALFHFEFLFLLLNISLSNPQRFNLFNMHIYEGFSV